MRYEELTIEGRNAVLEAFRAGKPIDKLFVLDGCQDGPVLSITREAKKHDTIINYVAKERLWQKKKESRRLFSCWIILKTPITWGQLSVLQTWQARMGWLSRKDVLPG